MTKSEELERRMQARAKDWLTWQMRYAKSRGFTLISIHLTHIMSNVDNGNSLSCSAFSAHSGGASGDFAYISYDNTWHEFSLQVEQESIC
jgi:hypothetical protein